MAPSSLRCLPGLSSSLCVPGSGHVLHPCSVVTWPCECDSAHYLLIISVPCPLPMRIPSTAAGCCQPSVTSVSLESICTNLTTQSGQPPRLWGWRTRVHGGPPQELYQLSHEGTEGLADVPLPKPYPCVMIFYLFRLLWDGMSPEEGGAGAHSQTDKGHRGMVSASLNSSRAHSLLSQPPHSPHYGNSQRKSFWGPGGLYSHT